MFLKVLDPRTRIKTSTSFGFERSHVVCNFTVVNNEQFRVLPTQDFYPFDEEEVLEIVDVEWKNIREKKKKK